MRRFCQRRCRLLLLVTRNWPHVHSASEEEVGSESDPSDAEVVPDPPELLLVPLSLLLCAGADLGRRTLDLRRRLLATVPLDSLLASLELLSLPLVAATRAAVIRHYAGVRRITLCSYTHHHVTGLAMMLLLGSCLREFLRRQGCFSAP